MPAIEFEAWRTPFEQGNLYVAEVRWGEGRFTVYTATGFSYESPGMQSGDVDGLLATVVHEESLGVYQITYPGVSGFRVLDENARPVGDDGAKGAEVD